MKSANWTTKPPPNKTALPPTGHEKRIPLRGIISARPELLIWLITRPLSLDGAWRRDKSRHWPTLQTDKDERKRGDEETTHPAALGQRRLQISQLNWHHPPISSECSILRYMCLSLQNHMVLGRNFFWCHNVSACVLAWDGAPEGWAH